MKEKGNRVNPPESIRSKERSPGNNREIQRI